MNSFPDDHPIEILRGFKRPTRECARRRLARRAAWLVKRIEEDAFLQRDRDYRLEELAALVACIEAADDGGWPVDPASSAPSSAGSEDRVENAG